MTEKRDNKTVSYKTMSVLFVDDDELFLETLKNGLEEEEFSQEYTNSGKQALEILEKKEFHVIVADMKMPEMDGMSLVAKVKEKYPDIVRIVLTGFTNPTEILESINIGEIFRYIIKPWISENEFIAYIKEALDYYNLKMMERRLFESEERYRVLFESSPDGIAITNIKTKKPVYVNPALCKMTGYSEKELKEKKLLDLTPEEMKEYVISELMSHNKGDKSLAEDIPIRCSDWTVRYMDINSESITIGGIEYFINFFRDTTERKRAEEALRKSEGKYRTLMHNINVGVFRNSVGPTGRFIEANPTIIKMFGFEDKEEFLLRSISSLYQNPKDSKSFNEKMLKTGFVKNEELKLKRKDGMPFLASLSVVAVKDENGEYKYFDGVIEDITERKYMEMQFRQTQKLEAIGQMAAGIAHEINSPIQYIGYNISLFNESFSKLIKFLKKQNALLEAFKNGSSSQEYFKELENDLAEVDIDCMLAEVPAALKYSKDGIDRVSKIVGAMKEFCHPGESKKIPIDINKAIKGTIIVSRNEWKYVAEMKTDFAEDMPQVLCIPDEFNQIILNIVLNAAQAISEVVGDGAEKKGRITISTHHDKDWAEIRISDTGIGIPKEEQPKIFNLFYTTKEVGKGTGQGLAICHNYVVKKHNGTITFETAVGKGTTFIIRLPIGNIEDSE
ncbi:MAG: PAS domain S-box protein [Candidatus Cloacimonetes bacterium]|nr:PAS domain S-box protein [Candidatus Cloacimonadota bacterium]